MLSDDDRHKLANVRPELYKAMQRVLEAMSALGYPMRVVEGLRTAHRQQTLYAQGRTKPGPIVTNLDGITKKSKHQTGDAVDCAFTDAHGKLTWSLEYPWDVYGACGRAVGLTWGGDWKMRDMPHMEWPD